MKHLVTPYKVATYLLLLFFMGHTFGGMLSQASMGPASDQVFEAMKTVHFDFRGSDSTWYGFWFGFGLMASAYLLLTAFITWWLDRVPPKQFRLFAPIAWGLTAAQAATAVLSILYFFSGPATFGILITVFIAVGTVRKSRLAASAL
jgi:heme A synthase